MASEDCDWLRQTSSGYSCGLRNAALQEPEVRAKCKVPDLSVICVDAYSSLARGQEAVDSQSTDAFPWFIEAATQFENLRELDNAVQSYVKAIDFARKIGLYEKGYDLFRNARYIVEEAYTREDQTIMNSGVKNALARSGQALIDSMKEMVARSDVTDMQAELKASLLGGVTLKKAERDETKDLVISHGRALYSKKSKEYKEGAETYLNSGMLQNAVTFACMAALADLMLGKPKEGLVYLTKLASESGYRDKFHEDICFKWTKLVFRGLVSRDQDAIDSAKTMFLQIPWSFKDDKEFARRVMDSVERRLSW